MTVRPDFFIAGAAKCGTTALYTYLARHPGVFMSQNKEPKFFCTDLKTSGGVYAPQDYEALFAAAPEGSLAGEASTLYLYSEVAIRRIMQHNPAAKIIAMLRYPVEAAQSLHAAAWSHGHENVEDFEAAWRAQRVRAGMARESAPPWPHPATLQYGRIYRYAAQVRRVLEQVPREQCHFIVYEEFFADPRAHYACLLEFLRLPPDPSRTEFPVVNPAVMPRSRRMQHWLHRPPAWLKTLYSPLRPLCRLAGVDLTARARALNNVTGRKASLRPGFRAELDRYFADDIAELEGLLGRRLWAHLRAQ